MLSINPEFLVDMLSNYLTDINGFGINSFLGDASFDLTSLPIGDFGLDKIMSTLGSVFDFETLVLEMQNYIQISKLLNLNLPYLDPISGELFSLSDRFDALSGFDGLFDTLNVPDSFMAFQAQWTELFGLEATLSGLGSFLSSRLSSLLGFSAETGGLNLNFGYDASLNALFMDIGLNLKDSLLESFNFQDLGGNPFDGLIGRIRELGDLGQPVIDLLTSLGVENVDLAEFDLPFDGEGLASALANLNASFRIGMSLDDPFSVSTEDLWLELQDLSAYLDIGLDNLSVELPFDLGSLSDASFHYRATLDGMLAGLTGNRISFAEMDSLFMSNPISWDFGDDYNLSLPLALDLSALGLDDLGFGDLSDYFCQLLN